MIKLTTLRFIMKIKWDFNREYQTEAVNAIIDLFKGQNSMLQYFTVFNQAGIMDAGKGIGNKIDISYEDILENLRKVQSYNKLQPSEHLNFLNFDIEMEKGTGKTYVYLKTIFELNKKYGFTKFIIVVSDKFQRNYVNNMIEDTKEHFKEHYDNIIYDNFVFDSSKLEYVRNFVENSNIQIMIINIDAFNKNFTDSTKETKANIIHRKQDNLMGYKPIDLIAKTNPVVIIGEHEKVIQGKNEESISFFNPLFTLRYSSYHKDSYNLVYKLDILDVIEKSLNKQLDLISFEYPVVINDIYIKLISIKQNKSFNSAKIEINANVKGKIRRKRVTVKEGFDLSEFKLSNLEAYEGWIVDKINVDEEYISFTNTNEILKIGKNIHDLDELFFARLKIRKTIEEHFKKELTILNNNYDIKVFSVFIFDDLKDIVKISKNFIKGDYLRLFEEEFIYMLNNPNFTNLNYLKNSEIKNYYKIFNSKDFMNNDELYDSNLKFIFLNSELINEFINCNIFQICNLTHSDELSHIDQRNMGIQLCIDIYGNLVYDKNINILSIITNESSSNFARNLQKEIEKDSKIQFGLIKKSD